MWDHEYWVEYHLNEAAEEGWEVKCVISIDDYGNASRFLMEREKVEVRVPYTLKDCGYAPGNYICKCSDCKKTHIADKRAWRCVSCADTMLKRGK
jgi:hypothetical protein